MKIYPCIGVDLFFIGMLPESKKKKKKRREGESGKWQFNTTRLSSQFRMSLCIHEFFTCPLNRNNKERLFHQGKCYFKIQWAVLRNFKPEFTVALVKLQWPLIECLLSRMATESTSVCQDARTLSDPSWERAALSIWQMEQWSFDQGDSSDSTLMTKGH